MISLKTQEEIEKMREGGKILAQILKQIAAAVRPGVGTEDLEKLAAKLIAQAKAKPAFLGYTKYPCILCTSINHEVVHAPPIPNRILKEGDIIGIDIGLEYKGLFTDMAQTVAVGKVSSLANKLINVTRECLALGLKQVKENNYLSDIARAIETHATKNGFSVVQDLVGHGVGHKVHEAPNVPNFVTQESEIVRLKKGMAIAIEPMINIGGWEIETLNDGWTIVTADGSLSAHFEHTVAIDHNGKTIIITEL